MEKTREQQTIVGGLRSGKFIKKNWSEKTRLVDAFDVKADVIKTLKEYGILEHNLHVTSKSKSCYHPGRSGHFISTLKMVIHSLISVKYIQILFQN